MNTYADMVTLLLCFFVLLFALSTIDAQKFKVIMSSFQNSLGVLESGKTIEESQLVDDAFNENKSTIQMEELEDFRKLQEEVQQYLDRNGMDDEVLVELETRGLLLRFSDNVLFDSGYANLKPVAKETLTFLAGLLTKDDFLDKHIRVEGHTDSDPIYSSKYPTNWELSVARSSNVVRFLAEEMLIDPLRLSASGYSEYHPVAPNDNDINKAKNRRVDIVILRTEFIKSEPYSDQRSE